MGGFQYNTPGTYQRIYQSLTDYPITTTHTNITTTVYGAPGDRFLCTFYFDAVDNDSFNWAVNIHSNQVFAFYGVSIVVGYPYSFSFIIQIIDSGTIGYCATVNADGTAPVMQAKTTQSAGGLTDTFDLQIVFYSDSTYIGNIQGISIDKITS